MTVLRDIFRKERMRSGLFFELKSFDLIVDYRTHTSLDLCSWLIYIIYAERTACSEDQPRPRMTLSVSEQGWTRSCSVPGTIESFEAAAGTIDGPIRADPVQWRGTTGATVGPSGISNFRGTTDEARYC
jgi:hypothetical protein